MKGVAVERRRRRARPVDDAPATRRMSEDLDDEARPRGRRRADVPPPRGPLAPELAGTDRARVRRFAAEERETYATWARGS